MQRSFCQASHMSPSCNNSHTQVFHNRMESRCLTSPRFLLISMVVVKTMAAVSMFPDLHSSNAYELYKRRFARSFFNNVFATFLALERESVNSQYQNGVMINIPFWEILPFERQIILRKVILRSVSRGQVLEHTS